MVTDDAPIAATSYSPEVELDYPETTILENSLENKPVSRLITFPGVRVVPEWRKELGERVREVQEQKAREAALEAEAAERLRDEQPNTPSPQLELLPQAELAEMNPLVAKALARIQRAHQTPAPSNYQRNATYGANAVAAATARERVPAQEPEAYEEPVPERTHNLVVVPSPVIKELPLETEALAEPVETPAEPPAEVATEPPTARITRPKPKRIIADDENDPALSYLDSIPLAGGPAHIRDRASIPYRVVAAVIDAVAVGFLSLPFAAILELQDANWLGARTLGLMGGIAAGVMFVYATISTALTGRTLGMRLISLRAIDVRTGLIPTGKQSATRSLVYLLSLGTLGLGLVCAFARGEGKTAHDRLSRTAVVED